MAAAAVVVGDGVSECFFLGSSFYIFSYLLRLLRLRWGLYLWQDGGIYAT